MKDTTLPLRMAVYNVLNNALSFDGDPVPVADKKRRITSNRQSLYVVLGSQRENDAIQTDEYFFTNSELDITIWQLTEFETSEDPLDSVANQILQLLFPAAAGDVLTYPGFLIMNARRLSSVTQDVSIDENQTILQKTITITAQIIEQNP